MDWLWILVRATACAIGLFWGGAVVNAGDVVVDPEDVTRNGSGPLMLPDVTGHKSNPDLPTVDPAVQDPEAKLLSGLVARGTSQGFDGILYENRDREHSSLPPTLFPNLTFLKYDDALVKHGLDYGYAGAILIPSLVFGNSSTAHTGGTRPRSLVRNAMTTAGGAAVAFRDYVNNSIYVYPEHRDHDAVDLYPANWPYTITSQGSSRSDKPFMKAVAMTLAAFPPDTRAALEASGLIAPTVQMILRRNLTLVRTQKHYRSPLAHPSVFSGDRLRIGRMIGQAAALRPEDIPPLVRLRVLSEGFQRKAGIASLDEHLFTTPSAISRVWRSLAWEQDMVVSTEPTKDPNGRALSFHWVLLRGDPDRVRIEPLDPDGTSARITINWHDPLTLRSDDSEENADRQSSRVDIGVFAWNGRTDSAPAFISVSFPTHQEREYAPAANGTQKIASVNFDALGREESFDPALHWSAPWTDTFAYSEDGDLVGWVRIEAGRATEFLADGGRADGASFDYLLEENANRVPILMMKSAETD